MRIGLARLLLSDLIDQPRRAEWAEDEEAQRWAVTAPADSVADQSW